MGGQPGVFTVLEMVSLFVKPAPYGKYDVCRNRLCERTDNDLSSGRLWRWDDADLLPIAKILQHGAKNTGRF